jgi:anti-sigma factor RsiW
MTCRKARRLIPLYAGDDLGPRRTQAVRAHIEACPACRRELEELREALARFKAAAKDERVPDWSEGEWRALMARAAGQEKAGRKAEAGLGGPFRGTVPIPGQSLRWAAASALGALIGLVVLSVLFRGPGPGPEERPQPLVALADAGRAQDVVSMTMVSQETGLQIVWFLDKNFDYEGEQE